MIGAIGLDRFALQSSRQSPYGLLGSTQFLREKTLEPFGHVSCFAKSGVLLRFCSARENQRHQNRRGFVWKRCQEDTRETVYNLVDWLKTQNTPSKSYIQNSPNLPKANPPTFVSPVYNRNTVMEALCMHGSIIHPNSGCLLNPLWAFT